MSKDFLLFAFDPGEKNNGYAMFRVNRDEKRVELKTMTVFSREQLEDTLKVIWGMADQKTVDCIFVIENFRVDQNSRSRTARTNVFQWSEMQTIRIIGKLELVAAWIEAPVVFQEPGILAMARKWCDLTLPKGHIPDQKSAYIHGAHYLMNQNIISVPEQIIKFGQEPAF